jgi:hypothetical protein
MVWQFCTPSLELFSSVSILGCDQARRQRAPQSLCLQQTPHVDEPLFFRVARCCDVLKTHVISVCFMCFIGTLQLFHADVAKVDQDVAYVAMVVHVCCKGLSPMFHLCFRMDVASVFYLDVASVLSRYCVCFCNNFQVFSRWFFASVSSAFRYMMQVLHLDF